MEIHLKTEQTIKIMSLIPKAFHATGLDVKLSGSSKPSEIKIYFSDSVKDLENKNFSDLAYIQFKSDVSSKSRDNYRPSYNCLDRIYNYCIIETGRPNAISADAILYYEGI